MTFISYAQNYEDVMLWRALKYIKKGFYIDVGANDPKVHSVTKAFYDRGWRGVNIEPIGAFFDRLVEERPEDVNLRLIASDHNHRATFYDIADTGLSTTERRIADDHARAGHDITEIQVEAQTLDAICDAHVEREVHFLKIDVEGGSLAVLEGMSLERVRPWIIVIEATEPMSQIPNYREWESLIIEKGYDFTYFDGLNRFYIATEHKSLGTHFSLPPNVFDDFIQISTHEAIVSAHQCEARALHAEAVQKSVSALLADQSSLLSKAEDRLSQSEQDTELLRQAFAAQVARNREAEERAHRAETDRSELRQAFTKQVARNREAEARAFRLIEERAMATALAAGAQLWLDRLRQREDMLVSVFESRSWRITAPLRFLMEATRGKWGATPVSLGAMLRRPAPTIFIECTHTYHSDLNTGIQRVVRNVLRNAPAAAKQHGYDVVPVIVQDDAYRFADAQQVLADKQNVADSPAGPAAMQTHHPPRQSLRTRILGVLRIRTRILGVLRPGWRFTLRGLAVLLPFKAVREFIYAPPHHRGLAGYILMLLSPFRRRRASLPAIVGSLDDFDRCDGSILLLLDSSWTIPIWPAAQRFRQRGGMIIGVVYDLIPITHPHTSVPELTLAFNAWLAQHFRWTDGFVCISKSTADMLSDYIRTMSGDGPALSNAKIDHFHLGSDLDFVDPADPIRQPIQDIFAGERHVFLMVGSIEPRKMHAYALDAFDRFWQRGGLGALIIIGRQSWKTEEFLDRVAHHPQLGRQLFIFRDARDGELDYCYRHASSLVIPSEIEGFGLPVVEAFQRGLPVMCSDIPVFREIADGKALFFSLDDPADLTRALEDFCQDVDLHFRKQRTPQEWIGWRQSTEQLLAAIVNIRNA